ncbi:hypothetical protein [Ornithinimicrobium faecis]|uniref:hypothetical protein n=1 Tax=Ornithinimicrobium faecis TaxID=2934158 RepID=UPI0021175F97|nr:hypothetical protein [Ornithinimicrobium sp. HY1745]
MKQPNPDTTATGGVDISTPHVDRSWRDTFVLEQRLADRTGAEIGDALAVVDTHCAESGESAQDAFGDPAAYSRSLVDGTPPRTFRLRPATVVGLVLGLFGLVAVPRAVGAWVKGTQVAVTQGDLVAVGLALVLTMVVALRSGPVLALVRHGWLTFVLPFAVLIALIVPQALLRDTVAEFAWGTVAAVGVLALALQVVLTWADFAEPDQLLDPRQPAPGRTTLQWLTAFIFPFLTLLVLGMDVIFRAVS